MIGSRLGAYEILAELGSGGMGKVYRAEIRDEVPGLEPGTPVAMKVIHGHLLETPGFFKRFLREADLGQTIEHENVVRTYDCDALLVDGRQQNFLVMEYVEGQTLRELLRELDRVPEELCRHIGREVAKGLTAIHEAGVVHRDLKPENVLITEDHVVKVMDLGVARLTDEIVRLSQAGSFVGSLEYAAPEQFKTADGEPDGRADLHALGVLLYELSTGRHPFRDDDASKLIRNILDTTPRKAGDVNPQLSPFFEELVQTLLAKEPGERFESASTLAAVLDEGEKSDWWKARARALRRQTKRPLRRIRIPRETALYGRKGDLEKLRALYEQANAEQGRVLLIEGEAGIGKTRLVDEFVGRLREAGEDVNFLFGSYPPGGAATAAGAFSTAYREQFGEVGLGETLAEYLTVTPVLVTAFAALLRGETTPTGAEPLTKDSLQTVFVHATRALAAERTTIVLIDDLHFAPEEGRALFSSLAMAVPGHRILLLGTMRPGVPEAWTANVTRLEQAEQRSLARLGAKDLGRLLIDAFRSEKLATELGLRIAQKSDGNPFFAFEIIRGLREGQFIRQQPDGTWVTTKVIQDIQVPSSVLDLVNARVADLSEEERDLLDVASCCGFAFEPGLVAESAGIARIPALKRFGQIERRHRLVRTAGRKCVFDHHQVQEALYGSLMPELREAYHAAIAEALEARENAADQDPKDLDGALCVEVCEHYLSGARGERALRYLDAALDHLAKGFLNDRALGLADRALAVPDLLRGDDRLRVLLAKNDRLELLGRREAQEEVLAEARALAETSGERALLARVGRAAGNLAYVTGRQVEAKAHFERHLAIARELRDVDSEAAATINLGLVFWSLGRNEDAEALFAKGRSLAIDCGNRRWEANATGNLGIVFRALGRYDKAQAYIEQHLAIAREIGDRQGEGTGTGNLGNVFFSLGRYEEAKAHHEQCLAIAREIGDRQGEGRATGSLGNVFQALGRYEEAKAHYQRHLAIAREIGDRWGEGAATGNLGLVFQSQGRYEEAKAHHERHLAIAREIGDRQGEARAMGNLGLMFQALGRYEEARAHYEQCLAIAREIGDRRGEAGALVNLGYLLLALGEVDRAREALEDSLALSRKIGDRRLEGYALVGLGAVADEEGDTAGAIDLAREAWALLREIDEKAGVADSLIQVGELCGRAGDEARAREALEDAVALLRGQQRKGERAKALALLANLPGGEVAPALSALKEAGEGGNTAEVRYLLWQATGEAEHLAEAKRLLDHLVQHAPAESRASMLKNVRLHREIMKAWAEHGEKAEREAEE